MSEFNARPRPDELVYTTGGKPLAKMRRVDGAVDGFKILTAMKKRGVFHIFVKYLIGATCYTERDSNGTIAMPSLTKYDVFCMIKDDQWMVKEFVRALAINMRMMPSTIIEGERHRLRFLQQASNARLSDANAMIPLMTVPQDEYDYVLGADGTKSRTLDQLQESVAENPRALMKMIRAYRKKKEGGSELTFSEQGEYVRYYDQVVNGVMIQPSSEIGHEWRTLSDAFMDLIQMDKDTDMSKITYSKITPKSASQLFTTRCVTLNAHDFNVTSFDSTLFAGTLYHNLAFTCKHISVTQGDMLMKAALFIAPYYRGTNVREVEHLHINVDDHRLPLGDMSALPPTKMGTPNITDIIGNVRELHILRVRMGPGHDGHADQWDPLLPQPALTMFPRRLRELAIDGVRIPLWPGCARDVDIHVIGEEISPYFTLDSLKVTDLVIMANALSAPECDMARAVLSPKFVKYTDRPGRRLQKHEQEEKEALLREKKALYDSIRDKHETRNLKICYDDIHGMHWLKGDASYLMSLDITRCSVILNEVNLENLVNLELSNIVVPSAPAQDTGVTKILMRSTTLKSIYIVKIRTNALIADDVELTIDCPSLTNLSIFRCNGVNVVSSPTKKDVSYYFDMIETVNVVVNDSIKSLLVFSTVNIKIKRDEDNHNQYDFQPGGRVTINNTRHIGIDETFRWPSLDELTLKTLGHTDLYRSFWLINPATGIEVKGMHKELLNAVNLTLCDVYGLESMPSELPRCKTLMFMHTTALCFNGIEEPFQFPFMENVEVIKIATVGTVRMKRAPLRRKHKSIAAVVCVTLVPFHQMTDEYKQEFCKFTPTLLSLYNVGTTREFRPPISQGDLQWDKTRSQWKPSVSFLPIYCGPGRTWITPNVTAMRYRHLIQFEVYQPSTPTYTARAIVKANYVTTERPAITCIFAAPYNTRYVHTGPFELRRSTVNMGDMPLQVFLVNASIGEVNFEDWGHILCIEE